MLTWPLASTALVVLSVGLMLAWYERSRPSARTVALVATMAALAVVGRIAFAPLPNVKPTTDIVLFAGFAFGAIPGFAVGAVAALVSNLFFGQGMHTPWQMLAWGGVGVLGALARPLLGQIPGRLRLAALCAVAGVGFGMVMDFSMWATLSGRHTLAEFGAISLRSAPFNAAHAIGNAVFALAFGPVLITALTRARRRANVRILPAGARLAGGATTLVAVLVLALGAGAATPQMAAAATPLSYITEHQLADGGFGSGNRAGALESGWSAMAIGASGSSAAAQRRAGRYLATSATKLRDPADLQRTILGLRAVGAPARDAAGRDLTKAMVEQQRPDGSFAGLTNQSAFAILALRADGRSRGSKPVKTAARFLLRTANKDGGFSLTGRGASSVDETAAVIQALAAAGHRKHRVTRRAVSWLRGLQLADGGFPQSRRQVRSNAQSTAWGVQALIAAGTKPTTLRKGGKNPVAFLRSLQAGDGHIRYSRSSDQTPLWVTAQAQLALAGTALPVKRRPVKGATRARAAVAAPVPAKAARETRSERRTAASPDAVAGFEQVLEPALASAVQRTAVTALMIAAAVLGFA